MARLNKKEKAILQLKCCLNDNCPKCPLYEAHKCSYELMSDALSTIISLDKENNKLRKTIKNLTKEDC